jgi:hypothetical protein
MLTLELAYGTTEDFSSSGRPSVGRVNMLCGSPNFVRRMESKILEKSTFDVHCGAKSSSRKSRS